MYERINLALSYIVVIASFLLGLFILYNALFNNVDSYFPDKASLITVDDKILSIVEKEHSLEINLVNDYSSNYSYLKKHGQAGELLDILSVNAGKNVTLNVMENQGNFLTDNIAQLKVSKSVYQVSIEGNIIRSYEEVQAAHQKDNKIMPFVGWMFLFFSIYVGRGLYLTKIPLTFFQPHPFYVYLAHKLLKLFRSR
ncbi:hypothetical protein [Pseudoalteromonas luteoviolacea]|uniref:Uncharacterized protein n=1 Tax=Pseudoalteromonas luteoviolacea H33 TaxID=1365251 RepID=A0A167GIE2_9GAMM|nr:hypothetical protein [Pseudoalteromonas luteoviolacea]KZN55485.1 hypothetical protein N476_07085 [Pseudoalteromonas luteoviolacea H33]KZN74496.1 hypothetical protein N477_22215 [Pseudoalteromonas luteoviolacea H33-S]MBQ4878953.1 hypothetical protein [Pseudoalteromonas luteoviolacea]MBQ4908096.1 hypothetical protein [Pseudoalteromonas luteoviolacea]